MIFVYVKFIIGDSMKCSKCNSSFSGISKYCPRCGSGLVKFEHEMDIDRALLNIYSDTLNYGANFSIGYLIFNFAYAFYKKLYFEGIISSVCLFFFIKILLSWQDILFSSLGFNFLFIVFSLFFCVGVIIYYILNFNSIYLDNCRFRIRKLIGKYGYNVNELYSFCTKDSRGNIYIAIGSVVIFCLLLFI